MTRAGELFEALAKLEPDAARLLDALRDSLRDDTYDEAWNAAEAVVDEAIAYRDRLQRRLDEPAPWRELEGHDE